MQSQFLQPERDLIISVRREQEALYLDKHVLAFSKCVHEASSSAAGVAGGRRQLARLLAAALSQEVSSSLAFCFACVPYITS